MSKILIFTAVLLVIMFFFFPKLLYSILRVFFRNFRFTFPVTVGMVAGYVFYDFLKANDPSGYSREVEFLAKPMFMIMLAGTLLKIISNFFKEL
jgi:amino acid transporter